MMMMPEHMREVASQRHAEKLDRAEQRRRAVRPAPAAVRSAVLGGGGHVLQRLGAWLCRLGASLARRSAAGQCTAGGQAAGL